MAIKHLSEYRDPNAALKLSERIKAISRTPVCLMEVCGTHTMSIFKSGVRSLLPGTITLLSGPGCPVCVTAQGEIDAFIALSRKENVIITTFGDLMRVPGSASSLQAERARGADVRMVYSAMDAVTIARENPDRNVAFLGVGFETTAPTIAAAIMAAAQMKLENFVVYSAHKLVPPALFALTANDRVRVDGFLLPGHVSVILGRNGYRPFFDACRIPCVIAGFEPADILRAVHDLVLQIESGAPKLENAYPRAVTDEGNVKARRVMDAAFRPADAVWRGLGLIGDSGLQIREAYARYDARVRFDARVPDAEEPPGCACGDILTGVKTPAECPLFGKVCTPVHPVGPCMVSTEGTCAAYHRYHDAGGPS